MDLQQLTASIVSTWDDSIVERLTAYVRIPNKSPMFDPQWEANGHMEKAVQLMADWCPRAALARRAHRHPPLARQDAAPPRRGARELPGLRAGCMATWTSSRSSPAGCPVWDPGKPVIREGKLYGRGAADDGYAVFSSSRRSRP